MNSEVTQLKPADENALLQAMVAHPFCRGLDAEKLRALAESAMLIDLPANEIVFREDDIANRFYLIREGKVVLESRDKNEKPVEVQTIGANDVLGWSWLFAPYYWHFDARTVEPTRAIFFYGTRLREQCDRDPALGYELMKRMANVVIERLQSTRRQLVQKERQLR
jgi:CRP/FNR family transcriptional regulator, cyclic AMP receptor protein